jgi:hypothetical protein
MFIKHALLYAVAFNWFSVYVCVCVCVCVYKMPYTYTYGLKNSIWQLKGLTHNIALITHF